MPDSVQATVVPVESEGLLKKVWGLFVFASLEDADPISPAAATIRDQVAAALFPDVTPEQALLASQAKYNDALRWVTTI